MTSVSQWGPWRSQSRDMKGACGFLRDCPLVLRSQLLQKRWRAARRGKSPAATFDEDPFALAETVRGNGSAPVSPSCTWSRFSWGQVRFPTSPRGPAGFVGACGRGAKPSTSALIESSSRLYLCFLRPACSAPLPSSLCGASISYLQMVFTLPVPWGLNCLELLMSSSQRICHSAQDAVLNPTGSFLQVSSAGNEKSIQTPLCCLVTWNQSKLQ